LNGSDLRRLILREPALGKGRPGEANGPETRRAGDARRRSGVR
jgi:hypothetical protein